jgi:hypothetical protein
LISDDLISDDLIRDDLMASLKGSAMTSGDVWRLIKFPRYLVSMLASLKGSAMEGIEGHRAS